MMVLCCVANNDSGKIEVAVTKRPFGGVISE
jgi:hypothetical protein